MKGRSGGQQRSVDRLGQAETTRPSTHPSAPRGRVLRAIVTFVILLVVFYATIHSPASQQGNWQPYLRMHAGVIDALLGALGQETHIDGTTVVSNAFAIEIVRGCDAIEPVAVYVSAVLASPVRIVARIVGAIAGAAMLVIINWLRLVMLFFVGIYWRSMFEILHESLWQAIFIGLAIVLWAVWVDWATGWRVAKSDAAT